MINIHVLLPLSLHLSPFCFRFKGNKSKLRKGIYVIEGYNQVISVVSSFAIQIVSLHPSSLYRDFVSHWELLYTHVRGLSLTFSPVEVLSLTWASLDRTQPPLRSFLGCLEFCPQYIGHESSRTRQRHELRGAFIQGKQLNLWHCYFSLHWRAAKQLWALWCRTQTRCWRALGCRTWLQLFFMQCAMLLNKLETHMYVSCEDYLPLSWTLDKYCLNALLMTKIIFSVDKDPDSIRGSATYVLVVTLFNIEYSHCMEYTALHLN